MTADEIAKLAEPSGGVIDLACLHLDVLSITRDELEALRDHVIMRRLVKAARRAR